MYSFRYETLKKHFLLPKNYQSFLIFPNIFLFVCCVCTCTPNLLYNGLKTVNNFIIYTIIQNNSQYGAIHKPRSHFLGDFGPPLPPNVANFIPMTQPILGNFQLPPLVATWFMNAPLCLPIFLEYWTFQGGCVRFFSTQNLISNC